MYHMPPPPPMPVGVHHDDLPVVAGGRGARLDPKELVQRVPRSFALTIVPQGSVLVVERLGRYHRTLHSGLHWLLPVVDRVRYAYSTKEQGLMIPRQGAVTRDNVMVEIDGALYLKIEDAEAASYNIDNPLFNTINLAQTTLRAEIGKLSLDTLFEERTAINASIVTAVRKEAAGWGVACVRFEIRDITVSDIVRRSMDLQAEAERRKRKLVLESEADAVAAETRAMGDGKAHVLQAEAQARATRLLADAQAAGLVSVATSLRECPDADRAIAVRLAEQYVDAFGHIAKESNTVVLPQNVGDGAAFTTQALAMFRGLKGAVPVAPADAGAAPGGAQ